MDVVRHDTEIWEHKGRYLLTRNHLLERAVLTFTASPEQRLRASFVVACTEKRSDESVNPVLLAAPVNAMKTTKIRALLMSAKTAV